MAYYFVDYENVTVSGLNGLLNLTENDIVIIFYSENSNKITFELHYALNEAKTTIQYQKAECGTKNALDFQLASYLGYLINSNETADDEKYYIVTKDNGFMVLVKYWAKKNVSIDIISNLTGQKSDNEATKKSSDSTVSKVLTVKVAESEKTAQPDIKKELTKKLSGYISDKAELNAVVQMIEKAKTKSEVNVNLAKRYKNNNRTKLIYGIIKPYIKDKK